MTLFVKFNWIVASLVVFIVLSLSSGTVFGWTGPSSSAPNGNASAPVNVGSTDQVKDSTLGVDGLAVFGNSLLQAASYLNWGATSGVNGYGLRDNAGTIEFKNSGGTWESLQAIVYNLTGGGSSWTVSGNNIYNANSGNVGIGTQSPSATSRVYVVSGTNTTGIQSQGTTYGFLGTVTASGGTAFYGTGGSSGWGGQFYGGNGVYGQANAAGGTGVSGQGGVTSGWGGQFYGANGAYGQANTIGGYGVYGSGSAGGHGVVGYAQAPDRWAGSFTNAGVGGGVYAQTGGSANQAVYGYNVGSGYYGMLGYSYYSLYGNGYAYISGTYQGSDERLKENISPLKSSLSRILALRPVSFDWKKDAEQAKGHPGTQLGLIAQDVQSVVPEAVTEIDAPAPREGEEASLNQKLGTFYGIEYNTLIPLLIGSIQEQQEVINTQHEELERLKGRIEALEQK